MVAYDRLTGEGFLTSHVGAARSSATTSPCRDRRWRAGGGAAAATGVVDGAHAVHPGRRHPVRPALRTARLLPLPVRVVAPADRQRATSRRRRPGEVRRAGRPPGAAGGDRAAHRRVPCRAGDGRRHHRHQRLPAGDGRDRPRAAGARRPGRRRGPGLSAAPWAAGDDGHGRRRRAGRRRGHRRRRHPCRRPGRARHAVTPLPARPHDVAAAAVGPAALGGAGGCGDRRGRLRQRVPLRRPADRAAAAPRRQWSGALHRFVLQDDAAVAAARVHRHPGIAAARPCGRPSTSPTGRRRRRSSSPSPSSSTGDGSPATCGRCARCTGSATS